MTGRSQAPAVAAGVSRQREARYVNGRGNMGGGRVSVATAINSVRSGTRAAKAGWRAAFCLVVGLWAAVPAQARDGIAVGRQAPDFALASLAHGNQRLSAHRGEVVAVLFWASWCGDCRGELERWERLHRAHASAGLVVLGVNVEGSTVAAQPLAEATAISFPTLLDTGQQVSRRYKPDALPMIVLVDRSGTVRALSGALRGQDEERLDARLLEMLDE